MEGLDCLEIIQRSRLLLGNDQRCLKTLVGAYIRRRDAEERDSSLLVKFSYRFYINVLVTLYFPFSSTLLSLFSSLKYISSFNFIAYVIFQFMLMIMSLSSLKT